MRAKKSRKEKDVPNELSGNFCIEKYRVELEKSTDLELAKLGLNKELIDLARMLSQLREDPGLSVHPYFVAQ